MTTYGITSDMIFGETCAALNAGKPQGIVYAAVYNKALRDLAHLAACMEIVASAKGRIPEKSSMQWVVWQLSREAGKVFTLKKEAGVMQEKPDDPESTGALLPVAILDRV